MTVRTAYAGTTSAGNVLTSANFTKLPGGWIGHVNVTANQTGFGAAASDITGLTVTVTVGTSRRIRVSGWWQLQQNVSAASTTGVIMEGGTTLATSQMTVAQGLCFHAPSVILTPTSGSHTYKLQAATSANTADLIASATQPAYILVEDLGPA